MSFPESKNRLRRAIPLFLVKDLHEAIKYYTEALGFETTFTYDDYYAEVKRDDISIHLKVMKEFVPAEPRRIEATLQDVWLDVTGVESLHEEITARNARILAPLNLKVWASLEFTVEDLDGNRLCFSELRV